jgi:probable F420-dependent oxidoreductase
VKFHIALPNGSTDPNVASLSLQEEIADAAEELGFEGVQALDHVLVGPDLKDVYPFVLEPIVLLTHLAARTKRIKLATSVIVLGMRNPFVVAKQIATLDVVSGGRVILGLGSGYSEAEFINVGAGDRFSTRGRRLDEAIALFRHLFAGAHSPFHGTYYSYETGWFGPLPPQRDRLPIMIGGGSEAAMRRAAKLGDIYQPVSDGLDDFKRKADWVRANMGDRAVEIGVRTRIAGTTDEMVARVRAWVDAGAEQLCFTLGKDPATMPERMREFARDVMPAFV